MPLPWLGVIIITAPVPFRKPAKDQIMEENKELKDRQVYELGYHLVGTLAETEVAEKVDSLHALLAEKGATVISEAAPVLRQLAYDIIKKVETKSFKFSRAYFGWVKFELDREAALELKKKVEAMSDVLRFLLIKTVRENTLYTPKIPTFKKENGREEKETKTEESTEISEAEIDKSIDELLVNEN